MLTTNRSPNIISSHFLNIFWLYSPTYYTVVHIFLHLRTSQYNVGSPLGNLFLEQTFVWYAYVSFQSTMVFFSNFLTTFFSKFALFTVWLFCSWVIELCRLQGRQYFLLRSCGVCQVKILLHLSWHMMWFNPIQKPSPIQPFTHSTTSRTERELEE